MIGKNGMDGGFGRVGGGVGSEDFMRRGPHPGGFEHGVDLLGHVLLGVRPPRSLLRARVSQEGEGRGAHVCFERFETVFINAAAHITTQSRCTAVKVVVGGVTRGAEREGGGGRGGR